MINEMNAKMNKIAFLLFGYEDINFRWLDKKNNIGQWNLGKVELQKLPIWVIFLIKTLPILLFVYFVSGNFFTERMINYRGEALVFSIICALVVVFFVVSWLSQSLRLTKSLLALIAFMGLGFYAFKHDLPFAFESGMGTGFFLGLIVYGFIDILQIIDEKKEIYYAKINKRFIQFEGRFIILYSDENYEEAQNEAD